uniref:Uncharacterized protein n=1 Tax=Marseillevirus LCMAC103 TaxID=2506604 RepID=A0A481YV06_9VIRU|nr:MAG: hypothetical protein LCMAC103_00560 [Marseillevirus LCMAC103]
MLRVYYRVSDKGTKHGKPAYIAWEPCLRNFLRHFAPSETCALHVVADNMEDANFARLGEVLRGKGVAKVLRASLGNSESFVHILDRAVAGGRAADDDVAYFVEDDYLHRDGAMKVLFEGLRRADYVALYDHADKYMAPSPNPGVAGGGEPTKVILTRSTHWKYTNSTCMTFAGKVKTLREDYAIMAWACSGAKPLDFAMWRRLASEKNRTLATPIPGYCTHGMSGYMSPLVDWEAIAKKTAP